MGNYARKMPPQRIAQALASQQQAGQDFMRQRNPSFGQRPAVMPNAPLQTQPGLGFGRFAAPPAGAAPMKVGAPAPLNPAAPPPGMQLNPNYAPRAPGDGTREMRPTDQMFVPTTRPPQAAMVPAVMPRGKGDFTYGS